MESSADIVVVGGGVIGLTTAYFLAKAGVGVAVLEAGALGREASWAGAGILPPGNLAQAQAPIDQLRAHSATLFPALSAELRDATGVDNGYLRSGGLEFGTAPAEEWRGAGITVERWDEEMLAREQPAVTTHLGAVWHLPEMAQVRNPRHLEALRLACLARGVHLHAGCPVFGLDRRGSRVLTLRTGQGEVSAARFLLATGAWTESLAAPLGWQPGIRPIRGQIALLQMPGPAFRKILLWGSRYLVPRADGRVLVGSTEEEVGFDKRTTAGAIEQLLGMARTLVPGLADAHVERAWAGLRPGSPDGLPFLGPVPGCENLYVAAGHFRAGLQLSPGTALVMRELLLDERPTVPLEDFRPERAMRQPAFRT